MTKRDQRHGREGRKIMLRQGRELADRREIWTVLEWERVKERR